RGRYGGRALALHRLDGSVAAARGSARGSGLLRLPGALQERARRRRLRSVLDKRGDLLEVADELAVLLLASLVVRAQDRARMHRRDDVLGEIRFDQLSALPRDPEVAPEQRLSRSRAQTDQHARLDHVELGLQPGPAGGDLRPVRLLVDAALAARLPLEVLDDVGDVDLAPIDARVVERLVEKLPGRPDERLALQVLLVAGLLADEDDVRLRGALAEDGLCPGLVERAGGAARRGFAELRQARPLRDERRGGLVERELSRHEVGLPGR